MRLIDADKFKLQIATFIVDYGGNVGIADALCGLIDIQPTAFDKERVLAKLYEKYNRSVDVYNVDRKYDPYCSSKFIMNAYKDAIEIVERGGIEQ